MKKVCLIVISILLFFATFSQTHRIISESGYNDNNLSTAKYERESVMYRSLRDFEPYNARDDATSTYGIGGMSDVIKLDSVKPQTLYISFEPTEKEYDIFDYDIDIVVEHQSSLKVRDPSKFEGYYKDVYVQMPVTVEAIYHGKLKDLNCKIDIPDSDPRDAAVSICFDGVKNSNLVLLPADKCIKYVYADQDAKIDNLTISGKTEWQRSVEGRINIISAIALIIIIVLLLRDTLTLEYYMAFCVGVLLLPTVFSYLVCFGVGVIAVLKAIKDACIVIFMLIILVIAWFVSKLR